MYAFVVLDPTDNTEGVVGFQADDGTWMPMVGADLERVAQLKPLAQQMAREMRVPIQVLHFTNRVEVETLEP